MTNGTRTRDFLDHNQALCQLSYGHRQARNGAHEAPRRGFTTVGILPGAVNHGPVKRFMTRNEWKSGRPHWYDERFPLSPVPRPSARDPFDSGEP